MILISFHGDASIKQKYLDRVKKHQELDNIIQGTGWDGTKGCAVGCTLENYSHTAYEKELGIPTWLAHVEDKFFEGMSKERAKIWPLQFLEAIPVGVNLEAVKTQFILYILNQSLTTFDHVAFPAVKAAIDQTIAYHSRVFESAAEAEAAARSARSAAARSAAARSAARSAAAEAAEAAAWSAARSAAWSAWSAARSAARSARSAAWSAAEATEAAAWSARSAARSAAAEAWSAEAAEAAEAAARSARSAAWSAAAARSAARSAAEAAARSAAEAAYEKYADKLLQLLSEAK